MALLITLALLGGIWLALYIYCRIRFGFARNIPEVEPLRFFFGNGLDFAQKNSYEIFVSINRVFREYKRIFKISFGPIKVICPTHPDLIQKVLCNSASMDKPYVYDFTRMGSGLLTAPCRWSLFFSIAFLVHAWWRNVVEKDHSAMLM